MGGNCKQGLGQLIALFTNPPPKWEGTETGVLILNYLILLFLTFPTSHLGEEGLGVEEGPSYFASIAWQAVMATIL